MLVNFDFDIEINGKKVEEKSNHFIAGTLGNHRFTEGDDIKKTILAEKIYKDGEIEIDQADFNLVKRAIENKENGLHVFARGKILMELDKIKEEKNK